MKDTEPTIGDIDIETSEKSEKPPSWEKDLVNRLAFASLNEQRRTRRWGVFFKSLMWLYLFTLLILFLQQGLDTSGLSGKKHTAVVDLQGVIADDMDASADNMIKGLRAAFKDKNTAGVILRINSPGGSPVQAGYINDEIYRLRDKYPDIPIYSVVTDICASGGYYVAVASNKIYANKASIVGSIGVRMDSFGFVDAMEKLGIERRLLTAGEHKGFLDPFLPENPADVQHVQGLLGEIHRQFIAVVKKGRGDRLKDDPELYSGLVWSGEKSVELGLVDGLASTGFVAREIIGVEELKDFTPSTDLLERFGDRLGMAMAKGLQKLTTAQSLR